MGFGVWTVATNWWGRLEDAERAALLENAVELGINFFDTADTYGDGFGEEILANVLGHKRSDLVIATKFGYDIYDPTPRDGHRERPQKFDREFVKFACEQSLRRLNTDYIDLYQVHNPRVEALERDELFEVLEQLQVRGEDTALRRGPRAGHRLVRRGRDVDAGAAGGQPADHIQHPGDGAGHRLLPHRGGMRGGAAVAGAPTHRTH